MMLTTIVLTYLFFSWRELVLSMSTVWNQSPSGRIKRTARALLLTAMDCPRCFAWWAGLALTMNITTAALASMVMHAYDRMTTR